MTSGMLRVRVVRVRFRMLLTALMQDGLLIKIVSVLGRVVSVVVIDLGVIFSGRFATVLALGCIYIGARLVSISLSSSE